MISSACKTDFSSFISLGPQPRFWGQTSQIPTGFSTKRDLSPKRVCTIMLADSKAMLLYTATALVAPIMPVCACMPALLQSLQPSKARILLVFCRREGKLPAHRCCFCVVQDQIPLCMATNTAGASRIFGQFFANKNKSFFVEVCEAWRIL